MESIQEKLTQHHEVWKVNRKRGRKLGGKNRPKKQHGPELPFNYTPPVFDVPEKMGVMPIKQLESHLEYQISALMSLEKRFEINAKNKPETESALMTCVYMFASKRQGFEEVLAFIRKH